MQLNLKIAHKGLLLISVPLICQLIFVSVLIGLEQQVEQSEIRERRSKAIVSDVSELLKLGYDLTQSAIFYSMTKSNVFAERFKRQSNDLQPGIDHVKALVANDPHTREDVAKLEDEAHAQVNLLSQVVSASDRGDIKAIFPILKQNLPHLFTGYMAQASRIVDSENQLQESYPVQEANSRRLVKIALFAGIAANILVAIGLAAFFTKNITGRLSTMLANTLLLRSGDALRPVVYGRDEIAQLDSFFHDMAGALAESARQERLIVDHALDIICSLDAECRFQKISPACSRIWGYEPAQLAGQPLANFLLGEDGSKAMQLLSQAQKEQTSVISLEAQFKRHNEKQLWMEWSIHWSSQEQRYFCVAHDITERKMLERMKQDFVNMVSHDLRTPLTSTQAFFDLLATGAYGDLSSKGLDNVSRLKTNVSRLLNLIDELLDIEKMESGKMELRLSEASISTIVESGIDMVRGFADQQQVSLENTLDGAVFMVVADSDRLIQVMHNLLSNAVKFSPAGSTVTIAASEENGLVKVSVIDRGCGIPEEFREAIFERYRQVGNSVGSGTGLGLAICRAIIDEHHGAIGAISEEGKGSTFWFSMPLVPAKAKV